MIRAMFDGMTLAKFRQQYKTRESQIEFSNSMIGMEFECKLYIRTGTDGSRSYTASPADNAP